MSTTVSRKRAIETADTRPTIIPLCEGQIPETMTQLPQWVAWKYLRRDGRWTKLPLNPRGGAGRSNNKATWGTFSQALFLHRTGGADGVGFVFAKGGDMIGIDLDDCRDPETGTLTDEVQAIVNRFRSTYVEVSPSGTGVKIFARAELPADAPRKKGWVEVYDAGRFFTVTGQRTSGCAGELNPIDSLDGLEIQCAVDDLVQSMREAKSPPPQMTPSAPCPTEPTPSPSAGRDIQSRSDDLPRETWMLPPAVRRPAKPALLKLWTGDYSNYPSQSEADLALLGMLAPYCDWNSQMLDDWFRKSGLMRRKWDQVHFANGQTYGARLLQLTSGNAPPARTLHSALAADIEVTPVDWLWPGWIALSALTVIDGDPGLGKSTVTADLAARLSRGERGPSGQPIEPAAVLMLSAEHSAGNTIRPRLEAARADLRKVRIVLEVDDGAGVRPPQLPDDLTAIEEQMKQDGAKLLIIDPLMAFLGKDRHGKLVDAHRDQSVRTLMTSFKALAERTGAAVVVVRHLNKAAGNSPVYRGGGSIGITGAARSVLCVGQHPFDRDRRVMAMVKCNLGPRPLSKAFDLGTGTIPEVRWGEDCEIWADELLQPTLGGSGEATMTRLDAAADWLSGELDTEPRAAEELIRGGATRGFSEKTLERARKKIGVETRQTGNGWVWSLPQ